MEAPQPNGNGRLSRWLSHTRVTCVGWGDAVSLMKGAYDGWMADRAPRLGAALAFYTLLSMAPIVVIVIAIAGLAYGQQAAEGRLVWEIQGLVGRPGALVIQSLLKTARGPGRGLIASAVGLSTLFFGATAVVNELRDALSTIWHVPEKRDQSALRSVVALIKSRFLSFAVVVATGFVLMVFLILNAWLATFGQYAPSTLVMPRWALHAFYWAGSFAILMVLFAVLFKFMPDVVLEWKDVLVGAAVTTLLFSIGKYLIGLYLGSTTVATAYGAAGSLVIVLVWVYYSGAGVFLRRRVYVRLYPQVWLADAQASGTGGARS